MYSVQVRVDCLERFSEVLVGNVEEIEGMIESIVSTALLELFDTVQVEDVRVVAPQKALMGMESLLPNE